MPGTADPCPLLFNVSPARAGPNCQIKIVAYPPAQDVGATLGFWWSTGSPAFNSTTSLPDNTDHLSEVVSCPSAGTFYLGVQFTKCPVCALGASGVFDLTAYYVINGVPQIDIDSTQTSLSSWVEIASGGWAFFNYNFTTTASAHFNIQKGTTSIGDGYGYYYAPTGTDFTNTSAITEVSASATDIVQLPNVGAGNWTFGVLAKTVLGTTTQFRATYSYNMDATTSYPTSNACPKILCGSVMNCNDCSSGNCNWCENTRTCSQAATCGNGTAPVTSSSGTCFDIASACKNITNCASCVTRSGGGCIWCATFGIQAIGTCSAGMGNNGQTCDLLTAKAVTTQAACPAGAAALAAPRTLIAAMLLLLVLAFAF